METMKFKVGDKVRVKSLEWYNGNKDANGLVYIDEQGVVFDKTMANLCGKIVQIEEVNKTGYFINGEVGFFEDWMLEDEPVKDIKNRVLTKEEAQDVVRCTKYALNNKNENANLQKKLFEIGCKWEDGCQKVQYECCNYLFVNGNLYISMADEKEIFMEEIFEELEVNDILNIEIKEKDMETKEMTKEEVFAYLDGAKIICTSTQESTNVQKKLFELGFEWDTGSKIIDVYKYLLIIEGNLLKYTLDIDYWVRNIRYKQITVSEVMEIQLKEEKPKFDPNTLQPFDKVLVRDCKTEKWRARSFDMHEEHEECDYGEYGTTCNCFWVYCIPYNEETKHLHGTAEDAPEYYQIWKK